jgi:hypothetical protein
VGRRPDGWAKPPHKRASEEKVSCRGTFEQTSTDDKNKERLKMPTPNDMFPSRANSFGVDRKYSLLPSPSQRSSPRLEVAVVVAFPHVLSLKIAP